jgi:hypothetical protein
MNTKLKSCILIMCLSLITTGLAYSQITPVNVGTTVNDRTGDPVRTAFQKLNANDVYLNTFGVLRIDSLLDAGIAPAASWGIITGTLSDQTDLNTALGLKVPTSRTITINGTAYDLSSDRSWTINAGVWGNITGTLSSQTDLQSALDGKVPVTRTINSQPLSADVTLTKSNIGLSNVDNTADANKPVSTAQAAADALNLKIASNLSDINSASTARTNLGLGTLATQSGTFSGTHSGTSSGTNTGDQTNITGNAATVTTNANLTGDVTSTGNTTTLATVNSNVGSFGSATKSLSVTANGKGLITAISEQTVTPAIGSVTGLGTGVSTALTTPSSANLATAITDETGSGALVFATSPTFVTPILGTPTSGTLTNTTIATATTGTSNTTPTNTAFVQQELTNQAVLQTGTQTAAGQKTWTSPLKVVEPDATASNRGYTLGTRDVALTFPTPTFRPVTSTQVIAVDIMPNGSPTENANGFAWMDICDADILNNSNAAHSARVAITSTGAEFGSRFFNGSSAIPVKVTVSTAGGTVNAFYADATGKKAGLNTASPNYNFDVVQDASTTSTAIQIRNGSSGTANTDGFNIGIDNAATPNAFLLQREAASLQFWTSAAVVGSFDASGFLTFVSGKSLNTASLNFPSTSAQNSSDLTITVTGAAVGDAVTLGAANAAVLSNSSYSAWVSATNTVTVRFNNYSSGALDPAAGTFKVIVMK